MSDLMSNLEELRIHVSPENGQPYRDCKPGVIRAVVALIQPGGGEESAAFLVRADSRRFCEVVVSACVECAGALCPIESCPERHVCLVCDLVGDAHRYYRESGTETYCAEHDPYRWCPECDDLELRDRFVRLGAEDDRYAPEVCGPCAAKRQQAAPR